MSVKQDRFQMTPGDFRARVRNTQANCASNEFRMRSLGACCKMPVNAAVLTRQTRFQGVDESRGISKLNFLAGAARQRNIFNAEGHEKRLSLMHFRVPARACPLSRYCSEKIHERIFKVALA
jgi:hypothetical protein